MTVILRNFAIQIIKTKNMNMKKLKTLTTAMLIVWCAVLTGVAQPLGQRDMDTKYATELIKKGSVAPDFKMKTIDGKTFKLSKLKGKTVVLDFWASWCPDCRKDAPEVVGMYRKYHQMGVEFVGVSMDTDVDAWRKALETYGIEFTQVSELKKFRDTDISKAYGVKWIPSMVVIGPDGIVQLSTVLSYKVDRYLRENIQGATADAAAFPEERVSIDGDHGRLQAVVQKPALQPGQQCPMVLLCHGFGGRKEAPQLKLIADSLQRHGIASIRFDFNGHGESEGAFQDMTVPNEIEDAKKVIEYVRDLRYVSSVAIVGHSQGGVVAAMTAGELGSEDFAAVALLAPAGVLRDDAIRGQTLGSDSYDPLDPPEYVELWGNKLGRKYLTTAFSLPIYETAANYHGPALIVHGNADRTVPYTYGLRFHQQWPGSKWVLLEYYDHGFSQNMYHATDIVSDWLIEKLLK